MATLHRTLSSTMRSQITVLSELQLAILQNYILKRGASGPFNVLGIVYTPAAIKYRQYYPNMTAYVLYSIQISTKEHPIGLKPFFDP